MESNVMELNLSEMEQAAGGVASPVDGIRDLCSWVACGFHHNYKYTGKTQNRMSMTFGYIFLLTKSQLKDCEKIQAWLSKMNTDFRFDFDKEFNSHIERCYSISGKRLTDEQLKDEIEYFRLIEAERKHYDVLCFRADSFSLFYHKEFSLMNTKRYAQSLSELISNQILYMSGFTGEGFAMGIFKQGKLLTCHQVGVRDCLECYDLRPKKGNLDIITNNLPMFDSTKLSEFIKKRNAFYAQELFMDAMPVEYREAIHNIHQLWNER